MYGLNNKLLKANNKLFVGLPASFPITNLQNYYRFEDNANDAIGGVNGTAVGSVSYPTGKHNKCGYFNNSYVQLLANGQGTFDKQEYTIAGWIKINYGGTYKIIWSYDYTAHSSPYYAQHIRVESNGNLYCAVNGKNISLVEAIPNGLWTHLVCNCKAGGQGRIYVNSNLIGTFNAPATLTYYNQEVWIGKSNFHTTFDTSIDELGFWTRQLTQSEITALYYGGAGLYY